MKIVKQYFLGSIAVTILGLAVGAWVGWLYSGTLQGALSAMFLTFILSILEVSLSFDNAVVNAAILREMTPKWRHRFITWGILIAVFGMRIVFPVAIVSIIANVNPWDAVVLAATRPDEYAKVMLSSHHVLAGFGGSFLLMVALKYFFDREKDVHWIQLIEQPLVRMGKIESTELAICLLTIYGMSRFLHDPSEQVAFISAGIFGVLTFVTVDGVSSLLKMPTSTSHDMGKASAALFLYLEILDASFSFDGVVGAFALTNNLFIIAAGLGIGAMFVRSMTILLVEKETLSQFRYLEHGAFYAIGALAVMMLADVVIHVPEVVTGLIGAILIGLSVVSSITYARKSRQASRV